jgi:hypothetical protein
MGLEYVPLWYQWYRGRVAMALPGTTGAHTGTSWINIAIGRTHIVLLEYVYHAIMLRTRLPWYSSTNGTDLQVLSWYGHTPRWQYCNTTGSQLVWQYVLFEDICTNGRLPKVRQYHH